MNRDEDRLHEAVALYLDKVIIPPHYWFSIENRGGGVIEGNLRKKRGVRKGIPDIEIIFSPHGKSFFIELKTKVGKQSREQVEIATKLEKAGSRVFVARTLGQVRDILKEIGIIE